MAFEGWNDAGDAASSAAHYIAEQAKAETFAELDPEPFYDFQTTRPMVRLQGSRRQIDWPKNTFARGSIGAPWEASATKRLDTRPLARTDLDGRFEIRGVTLPQIHARAVGFLDRTVYAVGPHAREAGRFGIPGHPGQNPHHGKFWRSDPATDDDSTA